MKHDKINEKLMRSFDRLDESMNRTFNAMFFLYGGIVAVMLLMIIEAFSA